MSISGLTPAIFNINLQPDSISYYTLVDTAGLYQYAAGDTIVLQVNGFDVYNNPAINSQRLVTLNTPELGMEVTSTNPVNLQNGVVNFTLRDTIKQTGLTFTVSDGFGKNVFSQPSSPKASLDAEKKKKLRSLGYIDFK